MPFRFVDDPASLARPGDRMVRVGREVRSKEQLLAVFAKALDFPAYFGHNWDAFDECLGDLSWLSERRVVVAHDAIPALAGRDLSVYLEVLAAASIDEPHHGHAILAAFPKGIEKEVRAQVPLPIRSRWP